MKRSLKHLVALCVLFSFLCGCTSSTTKTDIWALYDFPKEEYRVIDKYEIDQKPHDAGEYLGRVLADHEEEVGHLTTSVYSLNGLDPQAYLLYREKVSWISVSSSLAIREGNEEPLLWCSINKLKIGGQTIKTGLQKKKFLSDFNETFRNSTPLEESAAKQYVFSHEQWGQLYFDLPCNLYYSCVFAQEEETGAVYILHDRYVDEETGYQTYICEVTDLLADHLPEDFWE